MLRLLYISDAVEGLTDDSIDAILKSAEKNNPPLGITGLLVFGGGLFTQVLEGPEQNVLKKYVKIMADPRHRNCRLVYITPTAERIFKDVSMAALEALPWELEHIAELDAHRRETTAADAFTNLMNVFFSRLKAVP
ncbi:MAG: BLUF domain-containing protein [Polaromonas sp.]|uniref:BLUF domain-containing protein n=1 Tax=Polaromonas sp. TaxID=1869339 RepID=UPI00271D2050|nr:BLUF domain-containing protein [Polaromonas sp.]MDO9113098.1 BLUF domain-containing protein [Polaromonas sp.]MDP1887542.1 BLUF domain-containing protein [Polaromonas sp.]